MFISIEVFDPQIIYLGRPVEVVKINSKQTVSLYGVIDLIECHAFRVLYISDKDKPSWVWVRQSGILNGEISLNLLGADKKEE